jgi:hypothetical protein
MTWILGIGRPRGSVPVLACTLLLLVSACSTDVEYLRAGTVPAGSAGGGDPSGSGGNGGSAMDDAGDDAEPDAGDDGGSGRGGGGGSDQDGGAGGSPPDARDAEPRPPTGIQVGVPVQSDTLAPSIGGMNYTDQCAHGDGVVIGVKGTVDAPGTTGLAYLKSVAVVCGTLGVTGQGPFQVTTTLVGPLPSRGDMPGTIMQQQMCPTNQVVVGFESRAAMYVDQLAFRCAPLTVTSGPDGYGLALGMSKPLGGVGGQGGNVQSPITCPNDSIAVGSILRAGNAIDAFGFGCAVPSLKFAQ